MRRKYNSFPRRRANGIGQSRLCVGSSWVVNQLEDVTLVYVAPGVTTCTASGSS